MPSDPSSLSSLIPALSALLERAGTSPIRLEVALCDAKELAECRERIKVLEALLEQKKAEFNRTEYFLRCQYQICSQIIDFCQERNVVLPDHLLAYRADFSLGQS